MLGWNFADVWETAADTVPEEFAHVYGNRRYRWADFDRRADGVAAALLEAGLEHQDKVALHLYNGPEYMETAFGALKAGLVPLNTNHRYGHQELEYIWNNADATAVVFHGELTETVQQARSRLPQVKLWIHADDQTVSCPRWAVPYDDIAHSASTRTRARWGRSGEDIILIYTGGTTGRPKGVMWRQHDLYRASDTAHDPAEMNLAHVRNRIENAARRPIGLPASPLCHGAGYVFAGTILNQGGAVVTTPSRSLDVIELLNLVHSHRVTGLCIIGDAFCQPIVEALEAEPDRWDLSCLRVVSSSGMRWSSDLKQQLLAHAHNAVLVDHLSSSEASGMGRSIQSGRTSGSSAPFRLGQDAFVIDERGRVIEPGSGQVGRLAVRGHVPVGYYKDPDKTSSTFPVIEGVRCSVPGDYAVVDTDGSLTLLGRGSTSINTGGEKVFPEEVEQALTAHPCVEDAVVVGVSDRRFGATIAAAVAVHAGMDLSTDALMEHVRDRLAGFKTPRHVMFVHSSALRGSNGKADYTVVQKQIEEWLSTAAGEGPPKG